MQIPDEWGCPHKMQRSVLRKRSNDSRNGEVNTFEFIA